MKYIISKRYYKILVFLLIFNIILSSLFYSVNASTNIEKSDNDFLFDLKIKLFMKFNRLPSMVVCIIKNDSIAFI